MNAVLDAYEAIRKEIAKDVMEAGSPHTIYALVSQVGEGADGVVVEHIALPYDHEAAARAAERNQRPDWARWLRTGLAR